MKRRNFLKGGLAALVTTLSYAQESREPQKKVIIIVEDEKYFITQDKIVLDEKNKRVTNNLILQKVIRTYLINKELQDYKKTADKNLTDLNRAVDRTRISEIKKKLKLPIDNLIKSLKEPNPTSLLESVLKKLKITKELYKETKEALTSIYVDPRMYLYADITENATQAEIDYKEFILLSKEGLTDYNRAEKALELLVESEHILLAAAQAFQKINESKDLKLDIYKTEKNRFNELIDMEDAEEIIKERQELCTNIRIRARNTKEANIYREALSKRPWYNFQQKLKKEAGIMFSNQ